MNDLNSQETFSPLPHGWFTVKTFPAPENTISTNEITPKTAVRTLSNGLVHIDLDGHMALGPASTKECPNRVHEVLYEMVRRYIRPGQGW